MQASAFGELSGICYRFLPLIGATLEQQVLRWQTSSFPSNIWDGGSAPDASRNISSVHSAGIQSSWKAQQPAGNTPALSQRVRDFLRSLALLSSAKVLGCGWGGCRAVCCCASRWSAFRPMYSGGYCLKGMQRRRRRQTACRTLLHGNLHPHRFASLQAGAGCRCYLPSSFPFCKREQAAASAVVPVYQVAKA